MKRILLCLTAVVMLVTSEVWAQVRTISGRVSASEDGSPLPGVNVLLKGTAQGVVTDAEGIYSIAVPQEGGILVFSFIGLQSQEVEVGARSVVDVQMNQDVKQLSEIVVTGYGDRAANAYTGSAVSLSSEKFANIPVATLDQSLQGNVAGLQLSTSSGTPGSTQQIRIRGVSSISANNDPLFVIDGVPVVSGSNSTNTWAGNISPLANINPNDIESFTVLKDAGATAIYGARGANGVIVITTKKGKSGKAKINFSAQYGIVNRATPGPKVLSAAQWDELYYEGLVNAGEAPDVETARADPDLSNGWDGVTNTDWRDVVKNDQAKTMNYDVSISGGSDKVTYFASVGYMKQDGINIGSNYERTTGKVGLTANLSPKLTLSNTTSPSFVRQNGQLEGSAYFSNPDLAYLFTWPIDKPTNDDGSPNLELSTSTYNPLYVMTHNLYQRDQVRVLNSTTVSYEIVKGLKFTSVLGLDYLNTDQLEFNDRSYGDGFDSPTSTLNGYSAMDNNRNFNYDWKNMLDYTYQISDVHRIDAKLVYEAQKNSYKTVGTYGAGLAADGLYYPSSVGTIQGGSGYINDWKILSYMGMINYAFKGNIFVDATFRREGNSRFAANNRWGSFYSFGASWVFSDEAFMDGLDWLNTSKIRTSYGKTGNAGINLNEYQATLDYSSSYNGEAGAVPGQLGNQFLTWENQNSYNVALDFGVFEKITGTVEYFNKESYDLLLNVPLSRTTGFSSQRQNLGRMVNKGWEVTLNADVLTIKDFKWSIGGNFSIISNEVTELPVDGEGNEIGITTATQKVTVGQPVYAWYMQKWAGVDPVNGDPLWYTNGKEGATTNTYSAAGKDFSGGSAMPTKFGSLNTKLEYKGIYLSALMYFSYGNKVYDSWASYTQSDGRYTYTVSTGYARQFDRWQKPGDIAPNPKNIYGNTSNSNSNSTRRLYDGGYMRLRNVTLGYNIPQSILSKAKLSSANVYVMGTNLWTKTKDSLLEFDPELAADGYLDLNAPPVKTIVVGLNFGF